MSIARTAPDGPSHSSLLEAPESNLHAAAQRAGRSIPEPHSLSVTFRHSGWADNRRRVFESLHRTDQPFARTEAFEACGNFAYVLRNIEDPSRLRVAGSCCHDRFCLPCATERSCIIANNVVDLIRDREIRFLTLTIKTDDLTLAESLTKLYDAFQALRRRSIWKRNVFGGVAFVELTYSKKACRWHPHLHCLLDGRWIDQKQLSSTWLALTGDSYIVDIRRPASNEAVARYVTKYASKPFNDTFLRSESLLDEAIRALRGRKLAITFGRWRGKLLTATPVDGSWETVGPLDLIITSAAHGDQDAIAIMQTLTDADLAYLYARAPPCDEQPIQLPIPDVQLDFFAQWHADGTYRIPWDNA